MDLLSPHLHNCVTCDLSLALPGSLPSPATANNDKLECPRTSFIQSSIITTFALFVIWSDEERRELDWAGRIWSYSGAGGVVQGFAAGYFLWDLVASVMHLDVLGWGSLAHAVSALVVTFLGFVSSPDLILPQESNFLASMKTVG
jgi:TLC domain